MPRTELRGAQIRDTEIGRADINVATPGSAIIAKIVAGSGISISSTGADTGTGDVTITVQGGVVTPAAHQATHRLGGSDPLPVTALAGYPGGTTTFLRADGTFAAPSGGAASIYTHTQSTAATTWTITHNLGVKGFAVVVTDNAGNKLIPDSLVYTSVNVVTLTFAIAQAGFAYVSGGGAQGPVGPQGPLSLPLNEDLTLSTADGVIRQTTADGNDNKAITIMGGGAVGPTRGTTIYVEGNESSWNAGSFIVVLGDVPGAKFTVNDGQWNQRMSVESWGTWFAGGFTVGGYITFNRSDGLIIRDDNAGYSALAGGMGIDAATQGASVLVAGNTHGTLAGRVRIQMGSVAGAAFEVMNSGFQNLFNVDAASAAVTMAGDVTISKSRPQVHITHTGSTTKGRVLAAVADWLGLSVNGNYTSGSWAKDDASKKIIAMNLGTSAGTAYISFGEPGVQDLMQIISTPEVFVNCGRMKWPATQNPSSDPNTIDDYKEYTFTPELIGSSGNSGQTYSYRSAWYQKIGRWVTVHGYIGLNNVGTFSGTIQIPMPIPTSDYVAATLVWAGNFTTAVCGIGGWVDPNSVGGNKITIGVYTPGGNTYLPGLPASYLQSGVGIMFFVKYPVAN